MSARRWRVPRPSEDWFGSRLRSAAVATRVGVWLGICFGLAFVTGIISHYAQAPHQPVPLGPWPAWGYRVTQAVHVVAGTAAVPLLLVKLWSVYPRLFQPWPQRRLRLLVPVLLERAAIGVLVAGAILELGIGVMNVAQWYAWDFNFKRIHYGLAWVVIGALLVHLGVKLPLVRSVLAGDVDETAADRPSARHPGMLSRRALLRSTWLAAAVTVVASTTSAGTIRGLGRLAVLSPRSRRSGIPINRTARQVDVVAAATSADYRCEVVVGSQVTRLARGELAALPQSTHTLPIACVEGWSADGTWTGVRLRALLDHVGAPRGHAVEITSLQERGPDRHVVLHAPFVDDDRTLVALMLDGQTLSLDHGYPARIISPNSPGTLQTKWISRIEVL
ncbi:molybdopterin-dependent oxidoreductase [Nocardioides nematodiphilus]|uniref:molybdopterin-dependent oxidoreductase n=1 Tax=Nocardioides nematodiphilus TaxID=2849669 RepID=UPI001CDA243D|nr:molybdopterin-dependent oxidoreductase [Nocardioides nematodiphilus]MCA1981592.1 molybdopterin-dependent oxidoreductase [Nocardioides nematodiphilus]